MQEGGAADATTTSAAPDADPSPPRPSSLGNLGKDEILQIKIMYGGKCTGRCSRVHKVEYPEPSSNATAASGGGNGTDAEETSVRGRRVAENTEENGDGDSSGVSKDDELSSPSYWEKVHYRFVIDDALLFLDEKSALLHNITVVNVTVTERCLSTGADDGK